MSVGGSSRGWWSKLGSFLRLPSFTFSDPDPRPIDRVIGEMLAASVPTRIGRAEAMGVPAVQRGRNVICSISTLPLVQYDAQRRVVESELLEQIDPDVPNVVTIAQTVEDLLFEGIAWWEIVETEPGEWPANWPVKAKHRDVGSVSLQPPANGRTPSPLPSGEDPRGAVVYVDGREVPASSMIRFDSPNPGLLKVAGRPIRRALLLDAAAAMYADDPRPQDYFTPTEGADPIDNDDEIADILDAWKAARKKRSTGYVPAAMKYNVVEQPTPADLQLVELQKQAALDIANALGLDPEDLGVSTTSRTYQNAVDRRQDRINDVLSPYMRAITDRLSMGDVTRRGHAVRFDLDDYLRADPLTRWQVYKLAEEMGAIEVDEIRAEERLPALPQRSAPSRVAPRRAPDYDLAASRFGPSLKLDDGAEHQFADVEVRDLQVDTESRTITGLVLPYGRVAQKNGVRYRFSPGALRWTSVNRVKLLRDHQYSQALGRATDITETSEGVQMTFKVARGPEGDRALALAEDGVLDGLSVGVDFDRQDTRADPENRGVLLVVRADLREVSLTAMPAFDDARVTRVAAQRDQGEMMPDQDEPQAQTAPPASGPGATPDDPATATPAGGTFSLEDVLRLMQANGGLGQRQSVPVTPEPAPVPEQRAAVNPTRLTASVTEAAPYRFDREGNLRAGTHEFSTDLIRGLRDKDAAAYDRAMSFVRAQFDATNTTDTGALNPARQRPDMYVDQRSFQYPVWEAISKGTLTDVTPFVFPKFNSASGLVGAHTEGTEPSIGDFTATSQTVTPTAISGKAEINREVWDQGGNPQVSNLIWRQMTRGWYEALEAAAVAVLDAATPTAIALTAGGGTTGQTLASELTAAFASLHFVRGGFSMTDMFTQIDLYKAMIGALDDAGRPLFPALGPSNANGGVRNRFGAIDVNGVMALPAWALAASGSVVASSYLFDREVVHGWASAPQRLTFDNQVKSIYLGIWGYKATAISDINGVREITYDPVP